jgi:16S rRNA (uracil1498-N3)-methyltransferase
MQNGRQRNSADPPPLILHSSFCILHSLRSFAFIGRLRSHHNTRTGDGNERSWPEPRIVRELRAARDRPIIAALARRIHVPKLAVGVTPLDPAQGHHARDVLRLTDGTPVEVFDDGGAVARGLLVVDGTRDVAVRVERIDSDGTGHGPTVQLTVASAVPKGDRADWMVEKLSELGVAEFIPLAAARSVVLPEGKNKRERWVRIATEAAKQSRRAGVMRVGALTGLAEALKVAATTSQRVWYLATEAQAKPVPVIEALTELGRVTTVTTFIGPEGGWTSEELGTFAAAGARAVRLTPSILRVETAAVAVAALVGCLKLEPDSLP